MRERREAPVIECPEASPSKMGMQVRELLEVLQERFSLILKVGVHMSKLLWIVLKPARNQNGTPLT
jgi:hypothetical protein